MFLKHASKYNNDAGLLYAKGLLFRCYSALIFIIILRVACFTEDKKIQKCTLNCKREISYLLNSSESSSASLITLSGAEQHTRKGWTIHSSVHSIISISRAIVYAGRPRRRNSITRNASSLLALPSKASEHKDHSLGLAGGCSHCVIRPFPSTSRPISTACTSK